MILYIVNYNVCNWFKCSKLSLSTASSQIQQIEAGIDDKRLIYIDGCKRMCVNEANNIYPRFEFDGDTANESNK